MPVEIAVLAQATLLPLTWSRTIWPINYAPGDIAL
jgi:hypothetical protein